MSTGGILDKELALHIDGEWRAASDGRRYDDIRPATGEVLATAPDASVDDMSAAIAAARRAFDEGPWAGWGPEQRAKCLLQLASALERAEPEVAEVARLEWGVANDYYAQVQHAPNSLREIAGLVTEGLADQPLTGRLSKGFTHRLPHGVVGAVTPWNYPHYLNAAKVGGALGAGNTVVLKPSPLVPAIALLLARLVETETDIPPGVVNVVTTQSVEGAQLLTTDPRVDMVTFTGSTAVGRQIAAAVGPTMKRLVLELGGKSAALLLDDTDLAAFLSKAPTSSCLMHAGQACILLSRVLVPESLHDAVVAGLVEGVAGARVGDPAAGDVDLGPLVSAAQEQRVAGMIERARAAGATVVTGGRRPDGVPAGGSYYAPTVLSGVTPEMEIAQEEVFGPVVSVMTYKDVDDAVRIANGTAYGLVGDVWGADQERAVAVARRIRAGQVGVNGAVRLGPFGGHRASGIGREGRLEGLLEFTEPTTVSVPL